MQVNEISISMGYTLNAGNYESLRFDVTVNALIASDEEREDALEELDTLARVQLLSQMIPTLTALGQHKKDEVLERLGLADHNDESEERMINVDLDGPEVPF